MKKSKKKYNKINRLDKWENGSAGKPKRGSVKDNRFNKDKGLK